MDFEYDNDSQAYITPEINSEYHDAGDDRKYDSSSEDDEPKKKAPPHIPGHNANPILIDEVNIMLDPDFIASCPRHNRWKSLLGSYKKAPKSLVDKVKDSYSYVSKKLSLLIDPPTAYNFEDMVSLASFLNTVHLTQVLTPAIKGGLVSDAHILAHVKTIEFHLLKVKDKLMLDYKKMKYVEKIKDNLCQVEYVHGEFISLGALKMDGDLALISDSDQDYLMPTPLFLSALDKIQARFPLKYYWAICDAIGKYGNISILDKGMEIIDVMEQLRLKAGQTFYTFIKEWEALVKGKIITHEGKSGTPELFTSTKEDCDKILEGISWSCFPWDKILPLDRDEPNPLDSTMWLELVGIAKIFGHPILRGTDALKPLMKYGRENQGNPKFSTIKSVMGQCKKDITREFKKKMKMMPVIVSGPIEIMSKIGTRNENKIFSLSEDLWFDVKFGKTLPYDDTPDCIELIKDSACGVPLNHWFQMYDPCAFGYLHGKRKPYFKESEVRRVVLNYLQKDGEELKETLAKRSQGITDYVDRVVYLVMKEGELNVDGRAFTEQTYAQRLVQTSMEHNIASIIFKYVPQQSMTSSDLSNINRIQGQMKNRPGHFKLYISLDLKKWCIHQRFHNTFHIGEMYDQLMGTGVLFQDSHKFFLGSCIMNGNRLCPPDIDSSGNPIPGPHYLNDFLGGLEGMHQKKWTHFAVSVISLALSRSEYPGENIGQGDNQLIVLDIPEDQRDRIDEIRVNFLKGLTQLFSETGHILKPLETWASTKLHEYGKKLTYAGVSVSDGTKKASNIIPDVNDGLATHQTCISTINTATEGIARGDGSPIPAFFLNQSLVINYLHRKGFLSNLSSPSAIKMMLCPADFGGLPLSSLSNHLVRGLSDKVSLWISVFKTVQKMDDQLARSVIKTWDLGKDGTGMENSKRARLLEDIYCLNLDPLPSISSKIAEEGLTYLRGKKVKNPLIKRLANEDFSLQRKELVDTLCGMRPLAVGVCSAIFANTNTGLLSGVSKRFTKSKTIETFTNNASGSYLSQSKANDKEVIKKMKEKMEKGAHPFQSMVLDEDCPYRIANKLRERNWGVELLNATQPVHAHQVVLRSADKANLVDLTRSIIIETSSLSQVDVRNIYSRRGPKNPYMGGMTGEKIKKTGNTDIVVKTSLEKAYSQLHKIRSYTDEAPNLKSWMGPLLDEKVAILGIDYDPNRLETLEVEVSSGNVFHRLFSAAESPYAIVNTNPSVCTHFKQSSDMMAPMTANGEDYNIFFQAIYACNIRVLSLLGEVTGVILPEYLATFECEDCTHQVTDMFFDLPDSARRAEDVGAPVMSVGSNMPKEYPEGLMIKLMSDILAENIDKNFMVYHLKSGKESNSSHVPVQGVSLNDLRRIDFKKVFILTIVKSIYLRGVVKGWIEYSGVKGDHFSLVGVGELIISASLFPTIRSNLGGKTSDHHSTISALGVANYLGGLAYDLLRENQTQFLRLLKGVLFRDEFAGYKSDIEKQECTFISLRRKLGWTIPINSVRSVRSCILKKDLLAVWKKSNPPAYVFSGDPCVIEQGPLASMDNTKITSLIPRVYGRRNEKQDWGLPGIPYVVRTIGEISSAASKYVELLSYFEIPHINLSLIACLAEGSGSVLSTLACLSPAAKLIYNTLLKDNIDVREGPGVRYPPALVSKGLDINRIVHKETFMMGTTDILSEAFVDKAKLIFEDCVPDLITMDAESPNSGGSNMAFIRVWATLLYDIGVPFSIFKMFWVPGLPDLVSGIMGNRKWFFWKPISSNPSSLEIFCVFGTSVSQRMINGATLFQTAVVPHLDRDNVLMTETQITHYIEGGTEVGALMRRRYPQITHLSSKWEDLVPYNSCSVNCIKVLSSLLDTLSDIDLHKRVSSPLILNAIRSSNTGQTLNEVTSRILLIYCFAFNDSLVECIKEACRIFIEPEGVISLREGNRTVISFRDTLSMDAEMIVYKDYKSMLQERSHKGRCTCTWPNTKNNLSPIPAMIAAELYRYHPVHPWRSFLFRRSVRRRNH